MIQARELRIDSDTTVTDLYELIDMPYKVTNKSRLTVVLDPNARFEPMTSHPLVLRVEWLVEPGDPEV